MIRRLAALLSAGAMVAALLVAVLPAAAHPLDMWYMKGDGVPVASLSKLVPAQSLLPDYDQDKHPGRTLKRTDKGEAETDRAKFQEWIMKSPGLDLDGVGTISFWSAMKDFRTDKGGSITAYLSECKAAGEACSVVAKGRVTLQDWSSGQVGWIEHELAFDAAMHVFAIDSVIVVRMVADNSSDDDVWLAYDTVGTPTHLHLPVEPLSTTLTLSTSTLPTATFITSTTASTTSTTRPTTTTSTTQPSTTSTTTSSTSTTASGTAGSSTSPPPSTTTTAPGGQHPGSPPAEQPEDFDRQGLVVSGQVMRHSPESAGQADLELSPLQGVAAGFRTAAETIHSQLLASVLLGIVTAALAVAGSGRKRRGRAESAI